MKVIYQVRRERVNRGNLILIIFFLFKFFVFIAKKAKGYLISENNRIVLKKSKLF